MGRRGSEGLGFGLAARALCGAVLAWALAAAACPQALAQPDAGVTVTPPSQAQAAPAQADDGGANEDAGEGQAEARPEPDGGASRAEAGCAEGSAETAPEESEASRAGPEGDEGARDAKGDVAQGRQDGGEQDGSAQAGGVDGAQAIGAQETDAPEDAPLSVEPGDRGVVVMAGDGVAAVTLALAPGVKPAPGVYARGDALASVSAETVAGGVVVRLGLSAGGTDVEVDLLGAGGDGALVEHAEAFDAGGAALGTCGPAYGDGAGGVSQQAANASEPFRTDGYFSNTATATEHLIPTLSNARTGAAAFCNDMYLDAPGDPQHGSSDPVWYTSWEFSSDPATAAQQGQNYLDFILFWGYPTDPTVGGRCSEEDGRAATQWAIWSYTNEGSHPTWEAPSASWSAGFWSAYDWLVAAAADYHGRCLAQGAQGQPEYGTCRVWDVADESLQSILTASPRWGWLRVEKASSRPDLLGAPGYALAGAAFEARAASGSVAARLETDAQGVAEALVPVGSYTLAETRAPAGHGTCAAVSVQVTGGPVRVLVPMTDPALLGSVTVVKHAAADDGPAMAGARFAVLDADESVAATLVTGTDGRASTADESLPLGTYVLRELEAPDGFSLAADVSFEVTAAKRQVEVSVTDPYDTTVVVSKLAEDTGQDLSGAHLQVLGPSGNVVDDWVSDGAPHEMRGLAPGAYVLREVQAPAGYATAADVAFSVALTSKPQAVSMTDGRRRVPLAFTKADALTGAPLPGAEFALLRPTQGLPDEVGQEQLADASAWEEVGSACSDGQGAADFGELDEGVYLMLEVKAPDGYQRPTGGWLLTCDAVDGVSSTSVGDVPPASLVPTTEGLVLSNARAGELPHAGGQGPGPAAAVGATLAATGVLAGARARRRHSDAGARG